jgi:hypothetical protein
MPEFGRLDYLTKIGWVEGHAGIALVEPQRYIDKLLAGKEIVARFVPGGPGERTALPLLPSAAVFAFHTAQGKVPITRIVECAACGQPHQTAWECIL